MSGAPKTWPTGGKLVQAGTRQALIVVVSRKPSQALSGSLASEEAQWSNRAIVSPQKRLAYVRNSITQF